MNAIAKVRVLGPLALHADGVRSELSRLGYALGTVENHIRVMAHLSQWMADEGVEPSELSQDRVEQFLAVLKRQWKRPPTAQTLIPMLAWLGSAILCRHRPARRRERRSMYCWSGTTIGWLRTEAWHWRLSVATKPSPDGFYRSA